MRLFLNIGGTYFETTSETLTSTGSTFFQNELDSMAGDANAIFIDRDPTCFSCILNYLRTRQLFVCYDGRWFLELLCSDALYYNLHELHAQVLRLLHEKKRSDYHDVLTELRLLRTAAQKIQQQLTND